MNQLLDRYLGVLEIEDTTRNGYELLIRLYIRPLLGALPIGRIDGETLDAFYADLRRCHDRCWPADPYRPLDDGRHACDYRCGPHVCKPLGASYLRQIQTVLNGAFTRAVRWRWIGTNPVRQAEAPPQPPADPQPPTAWQVARIVAAAWNDPDWGMLAWLALTTGARRGELCALRWDRIDFTTGVISIRTAIAQVNMRTWEKDATTHQRRRIVADPRPWRSSRHTFSTRPGPPPPSASICPRTASCSPPRRSCGLTRPRRRRVDDLRVYSAVCRPAARASSKGPSHTSSMVGRMWRTTPRQSIESECARRGRHRVVAGCRRLLDGDDSDPGLIVALGGPAAQKLLDRGLPAHQRYWLRVWATRGLLWAWDDQATCALIDAARDEHWRVRELAAKVAARNDVYDALPAVRALLSDQVPRVREAALRAVGLLDRYSE